MMRFSKKLLHYFRDEGKGVNKGQEEGSGKVNRPTLTFRRTWVSPEWKNYIHLSVLIHRNEQRSQKQYVGANCPRQRHLCIRARTTSAYSAVRANYSTNARFCACKSYIVEPSHAAANQRVDARRQLLTMRNCRTSGTVEMNVLPSSGNPVPDACLLRLVRDWSATPVLTSFITPT